VTWHVAVRNGGHPGVEHERRETEQARRKRKSGDEPK
jgi:hypothetical protein